MAFDEDGETDAAERYAELTGAVIEDLEEDDDEGSADSEDAGTDAADGAYADEAPEDGTDTGLEGFSVLDAQIEDDDDLDEDDERVIDETAEEEPPAAEEQAREEDVTEQRAVQKPETGVGPAFIEPDFGDILDDSAEADDERGDGHDTEESAEDGKK
ncbi:hypothetical protein [Planomonospora algeriensis]